MATHEIAILTKDFRPDERLPVTTLEGAVGAMCANGRSVRNVIAAMLDSEEAAPGDSFVLIDSDGKTAGTIEIPAPPPSDPPPSDPPPGP